MTDASRHVEASFLEISFSSFFNLFYQRAPNKKFDKLLDPFFCILDKKHDRVSYFFQSSIFQVSRKSCFLLFFGLGGEFVEEGRRD